MKLPTLHLLIVLFSLWVHGTSYAQVDSKKIDQLVEEAMEKLDVVGVAIGIVKDGVIIHNKGYGLRSIETGGAVNKHTQFAIASNTKAFTTAALSILVDEGRLSWHDKVKDHIPEFKMYNEYVSENFNIQDLLTHRSGLGLGAGDLMLFPDGSDFTIKDVVSGFQYFKPQSAFRTKFDYDNLLYIVAGEVIAKVSGMSWEDFVKTRIMEPLDMDHSASSLAYLKNRRNLATPHSNEMGVLKTINHFEQDPEKMNGAPGGIYSNVDDLCSWMLVHLNKGKYGKNLEQQLFSEANHKEMWKIHTTTNANSDPRYNSHFAGYGLGWGLSDVKGNMMVRHGGGLPGMVSMTTLIPDLNLGVVILSNTDSGLSYYVTQTIIDSYLGLDNNEWVDKAYERAQESQTHADSVTTQVWQTVQSANNDHIELENFVGVYEDKWFGKIEILLKDNQLWFRSYRSPKLNGPMSFYKANAFAIKWEQLDMNGDAFAIFSLDEEGKAHSIRMKGISPNIDFSFDFQDLDLQRIQSK